MHLKAATLIEIIFVLILSCLVASAVFRSYELMQVQISLFNQKAEFIESNIITYDKITRDINNSCWISFEDNLFYIGTRYSDEFKTYQTDTLGRLELSNLILDGKNDSLPVLFSVQSTYFRFPFFFHPDASVVINSKLTKLVYRGN